MAESNQKKPRVIIFSTAYLPMQGGAELAVKEITCRIGDYEFDLICARIKHDFKRNERIGNVNVHRVGFGGSFDKLLLPVLGFWKARRIYKLLATSHEPLVLWGIMASWGSLAALLFKIFYPRTPFLLTLQEGDAEEYIQQGRSGMIKISWKLLLKKADYVQVISKYLAEMARKYGYKGEIGVVPNGVSVDRYQISSIKYQAEGIKKNLGISSNEKIIITVSRLVEKNGIEDLIEAVDKFSIFNLEQVPRKRVQFSIKLLILGDGPLERNLKLKTKNLKLEDRVIFLGDVPNEEVPKYLAVSDVFVRPSLSEGLGNAFLEAMAAGVPIIGTKVGGIPDFLTDPSINSGQATGLFCEVKNPKSIAEKINLLLTDDILRQKIIANARRLVEEKYDWDGIAGKIRNIFEKISFKE